MNYVHVYNDEDGRTAFRIVRLRLPARCLRHQRRPLTSQTQSPSGSCCSFDSLPVGRIRRTRLRPGNGCSSCPGEARPRSMVRPGLGDRATCSCWKTHQVRDMVHRHRRCCVGRGPLLKESDKDSCRFKLERQLIGLTNTGEKWMSTPSGIPSRGEQPRRWVL